MILRAATSHDAIALSKLEKELFSEENYPLSYNSFTYHIKNNLLLVLELDKRIIAYTLVLIKRKKAKLYSIGVLKEFRAQGFSSLLLENSIQKLHTLDFKSLVLEVRRDNIDAIALYKRFAFHITKEQKQFYKDGCDAYIMELSLAN